MPPDLLDPLLGSLRDASLLTPAQAEELAGSSPDAPALSAELLRRGWVTRFQAGMIADGRGGELAFGPYVLLDRLGAGGMGEVFKARHTLMNRVVALKVVREERLSGEGTVARFRREIEAAARLSHPNIVIAHDAAQVRGVHFYVMEYVAGTDLSRLVKETGPLPVGLACEVARQAALGLQHAHEKGLVHRDIKPSNLMLVPGPPPVVKVLDVGLARLADAGPASELTADGVVMGTPDYLAPEQGEDAHAVDTRADIYSLGCTLYHLLAGRVPFPRGSFVQKLIKHREIDPAPLDAVRPGVPAALAAVVQRMMAKRPADRYQTPAEVAAALAPFADPAGRAPAVGPLPAAPGADTHGGGGALVGTSVSDDVPAARPVVEPIPADVWSGLDADGPATAAPKPAARARRGRGPFAAAVAILVFLAGLGAIFSTTIIRVVTNKGELTVEVDDPNTEVVVYQGSAKVVDKTKDRTFVLTAGADGLVEFLDPQSGARALTREFRVERGGKVHVRATMKEIAAGRAAVAAKKDPPPAGADPDRAAAEWVLAQGGTLRVRTTQPPPRSFAEIDSLPFCSKPGDLPAGPFHVVAAGSTTTRQLPSDLFDRLAGVRLQALWLSGCPVGDAALARVTGQTDLLLLNVENTAVTGDGLRHLAGLTRLQSLYLGGTTVSDAGLAHLKPLGELTYLSLKGCPVGDDGVATLAGLPKLTVLYLSSTKVTDRSVPVLKKMTGLKLLALDGTAVSEGRLAELRKALPGCGILPAADDTPARTAVAWVLSKGGAVALDGDKKVTAVKHLPPGPVRPTAVYLPTRDAQNGVADRLGSADELAVLRGLPDTVRILDLRGQPVTAAALDALAGSPWAAKLETLHLQGAELTDDVFRPAARLTGLRNLSVKAAPRVDGSGLKALAGHPNLADLGLEALTLRQEHLAALAALPLRGLSLWGTRGVDDAGLEVIGRITTLEGLTLKGSPVTGAGLKHLANLKGLTDLNLADTTADDAGLAVLAGLPKLRELGLQGSKVTDRGLDELARCRSLAKVWLQRTAVTGAGVKKLAAALPQCRIEYDGGTIDPTAGPAAADSADAAVARWVLAVGDYGGSGQVRLGDRLAWFGPDGPLPPGPVTLRAVTLRFQFGQAFDDAAVERFRNVRGPVKELRVEQARLTDDGLARLLALPCMAELTTLEVSSPRLTAAGAAAVRGLKTLKRLAYGAGLSDADLARLPLAGLEALDLHGAAIGDPGLDALRDSANLRTLVLNGTRVTDEGLAKLVGLTRLEELNLRGLPITDAGVDTLAKLPALAVVELRGTKVTPAGVKKLAAARPGCVIHARPPFAAEAPPAEADRKAAEWALSAGATVGLGNYGSGYAEFHRGDALPAVPFRVHVLRAPPTAGVTDADLAVLRGLPELVSVDLPKAPITGAGLARLKDCTRLETLLLHETAVGDDGIEAIRSLRRLTSLALPATKVTDAGLPVVGTFRRLEELDLRRCAITDKGLDHLTGLRNLRHLRLAGTRVTPAGVARLRAALPDCAIEADESPDDRAAVGRLLAAGFGLLLDVDRKVVTEPARLPAGPFRVVGVLTHDRGLLAGAKADVLKDLVALDYLVLHNSAADRKGLERLAEFPCAATLRRLELNGSDFPDAVLATVGRFTELEDLRLGSCKAITDAGLEHLAKLPRLRYLFLSGTRVTAAGVKRLAAALPNCRIEYDGGAVGPGQ